MTDKEADFLAARALGLIARGEYQRTGKAWQCLWCQMSSCTTAPRYRPHYTWCATTLARKAIDGPEEEQP